MLKPCRYPKLPQAFDVSEQVGEIGISSFMSMDNGTGLNLNTTAYNLDSDQPAEVLPYARNYCTPGPFNSNKCSTISDVQGGLCNNGSDIDRCLGLGLLADVDEVSCPLSDTNACNPAWNDPIDFAGTGGFANSPAWQKPVFPNASIFNDTPPTPFTMPANPGLTCFQGILYGQQYVTPSFAQQQIKSFCNTQEGITLDPAGSYSIRNSYNPGYNNDTLLWITANWQLGDPTCTTGRPFGVDECTKAFGTIMSSCDQNSTGQSFGGSLVDSCIDYMYFVNGTAAVPAPSICKIV